MEIKRKKITNEEILGKEKDLREKVCEACADKEGNFLSLGYELELEFAQKENEAQRTEQTLEDAEDKSFRAGYVSYARVTVKRKKNEEELERDARLVAENRAMIDAAETEEEAEQLRNEKEAAQAQRELKRSVAFTTMMFVRVYKTFWRETISISENTDEIKADLEEFFEVLEAKAAKGE